MLVFVTGKPSKTISFPSDSFSWAFDGLAFEGFEVLSDVSGPEQQRLSIYEVMKQEHLYLKASESVRRAMRSKSTPLGRRDIDGGFSCWLHGNTLVLHPAM